MSESTKKSTSTKNHDYNQQLIKRLSKKYGVTEYYTRQAVRGARQSETCDLIKKEYDTLNKEIQAIIKKA